MTARLLRRRPTSAVGMKEHKKTASE